MRHSMQIYALNSRIICMKIFKENVLHLSVGKMVGFSMIAKINIQ